KKEIHRCIRPPPPVLILSFFFSLAHSQLILGRRGAAGWQTGGFQAAGAQRLRGGRVNDSLAGGGASGSSGGHGGDAPALLMAARLQARVATHWLFIAPSPFVAFASSASACLLTPTGCPIPADIRRARAQAEIFTRGHAVGRAKAEGAGMLSGG
ncbi:unnamed protein product, partial [Urochloa humidicola]